MPGRQAAKVGEVASPTCHKKVNRSSCSGEQVGNALQWGQKCLPFNGVSPFLGLYLKGIPACLCVRGPFPHVKCLSDQGHGHNV